LDHLPGRLPGPADQKLDPATLHGESRDGTRWRRTRDPARYNSSAELDLSFFLGILSFGLLTGNASRRRVAPPPTSMERSRVPAAAPGSTDFRSPVRSRIRLARPALNPPSRCSPSRRIGPTAGLRICSLLERQHDRSPRHSRFELDRRSVTALLHFLPCGTRRAEDPAASAHRTRRCGRGSRTSDKNRPRRPASDAEFPSAAHHRT